MSTFTETAPNTAFVAGATGATGRLLVRELLDRGLAVKALVRSVERLPEDLRDHARLKIICRPILDLSQAELTEHLQGCQAVTSCLGHTLSFNGIFGRPRRLVTDAVRRLCAAIEAIRPPQPVRFVLMNTAGNRNRDLAEPLSTAHRLVVGLVRAMLPPHADNEQAAEHLRVSIGPQHRSIDWVAVRPDTLIDAAETSPYELHASPTRSAIFNPGKTSRINVAHFIAELLTDDETWQRWRGRMPVIYNREET